MATALNLGIAKMKGEYFSWLSHDDMYYPEKIEKQIRYLNKLKNTKVFLYSNFTILKDDKIIPVIHNHEMLNRKKKYGLLRGCVNGITVLIPKSILNDIGQFDNTLRCTQDYDYWRRIADKYEFIHMEDILSISRQHSEQDSMSQTAVDEGNALWIDMIKSLPDKEKIKLEGTLYNFYYEMVKFLKTAPYNKTLDYCQTELKKIDKKFKTTFFKPKVSIIIPFYNRIDNTISALESAINQTYKNIEVLLIDDCSTDDTDRIIKYIKNKNNVKLITQNNNKGPAVARNRGILEATGEYIAFLDSDDVFSHEKIEEQLKIMSKHNKNISYTSYIQRSEMGDKIIGDPELTGIVVPRIISSCSITTPTVIVKRSLLLENNIFFNEQIRIGEDTCFWLEIAKKAEFLYIDNAFTTVNINNESHLQEVENQIIGVKNIITYLLNDEYYSSYQYDVSRLCNYYNNINTEYKNLIINLLNTPDYHLADDYSINGDSISNLTNDIKRLNNELRSVYSSKRWKIASKIAQMIPSIKK
ncbi:MAG: glycosyltransferase [Romboutsia sp.]|nr:glycosyltransferase [Romboutsia sp.]